LTTENMVLIQDREDSGDSAPGVVNAAGADDTSQFGKREALWITTCLVALLLAIFARMMNFEMRRDEQLYVTPAALLDNWSLYADFFYNHVPASAWLFHAIDILLGTGHILLAARLGVFSGWVLLGVGAAWISWKLTKSLPVTIFIIVTALANDMLLNQTGMTGTNNLLPLPFALLGFGCFLLSIDDDRGRPVLAAAAGLLLALAASFKANAIGFVFPVAIAALFLPRQANLAQRLRRVVLPLLAGGLIGAVPVFYYLITDPKRFLAHVVSFHTGPHVDYWASRAGGDEEAAMALGAKVKLAYDMWLGGANLAVILMIALLIAYVISSSAAREALRKFIGSRLLLVTAALIVTAALSFIPTPSFPQYFAQPLVCLLLLTGLLSASLSPQVRAGLNPAFVAATVVILLINGPRLVQSLPRLVSPASWTVMRTHNYGVALAARLQELGVAGKVATLAPIYPLEGQLEVYPEFATGQFVYRVADIAKPELLRYYRTTSPAKVEAFLAADPPAAILTGFDPELEAPMLRFAQSQGYLRVDNFEIKDRYGNAVLYVRPPGSPLPPG
jgi:hypothetical protein